jgi:hypothetical protein
MSTVDRASMSTVDRRCLLRTGRTIARELNTEPQSHGAQRRKNDRDPVTIDGRDHALTQP